MGKGRLVAVVLLCALALPVRGAPDRGIDDSFFGSGGALEASGSAADALPARREPDPGSRTPDIVDATPTEMSYMAGKVLLALAFVSALIVAFNRYLKRSVLPGVGEGLVKRVAVAAIAPNQFIHVIEVAGTMIVVGQSEKGITRLAELEDEAADQVRLWRSTREEEAGKPGSFARFLQSFGPTPAGSVGVSANMDRMNSGSRHRRSEGMHESVAQGLAASRERLRELAL